MKNKKIKAIFTTYINQSEGVLPEGDARRVLKACITTQGSNAHDFTNSCMPFQNIYPLNIFQ